MPKQSQLDKAIAKVNEDIGRLQMEIAGLELARKHLEAQRPPARKAAARTRPAPLE